MTTLTIHIPENNINIIKDIKNILNNVKGISFDFKEVIKQERVKNNLRTMCSEISSGTALQSAKPLSSLYAELS